MNWSKIWEAAKEPLRLLVLAVIPSILVYFEVLDTNWAIGITAFLRFIDKYLHLQAPEGVSGGLTRF